MKDFIILFLLVFLFMLSGLLIEGKHSEFESFRLSLLVALSLLPCASIVKYLNGDYDNN